MQMNFRTLVTAGATLAMMVTPTAAAAGLALRVAAATPSVDLLDVVVHNHDVIAIDMTAGGGTRRTRLMVGERIDWVGARGSMGLMATAVPSSMDLPAR